MKRNSFLDLFEKCPTELKELAFTHSSYAHDHNLRNNERVEFLGDSVLSLIVSDYLYKNMRQDEGKMTKVKANFVCTESLSNLAKKLGIESRIKIGKSFKDNISDAILENTIESMIGVMYLSFGLPSIKSAIIEALEIKEKLRAGIKAKDNKSILQEYAQANKIKLEYTCETFTNKGGQEEFRASVLLDKKFIAYGQGSTKREAEQNAAKKAMTKLKK